MDFSWSLEQSELYEQSFKLARDLTVNRSGHEFSRAAWSRCGAHGLLGLPVPTRYGGAGLDALTSAHVMEAFGRGCEDTGLVFSAAAHLYACVMPLLEGGDEPIRSRFLPRLCSGEWVGANAITEAEAGSDVAALSASAVREGDEYVIHGQKCYVTNGPVADLFLVYARTGKRDGHMGITAFAVERDRKGLEAGPGFCKSGLRSAPTGVLYLDGCRVPAANRVGEEGQGLALFHRSMRWERTCLFAGYLGAMDRQLEQSIAHARQRVQFRRPIARNQAVSHRIVDMKLRLDAARLLLYRAAWMLDTSAQCDLEVSLAKLATSEAAVQSGLDAIRLYAGAGCVDETGVPHALMDAVPSLIFSGTSDLQRNIIARELGL